MPDAADFVNLLVGLYGLARRQGSGDRLERIERLSAFVAQRLPILEERMRELESLIDERLSGLRQELEAILQAKLEEVKTSVEERLVEIERRVESIEGVVRGVVEGRLERIVYIEPGFRLRPLVALDAGFAVEPRFSLQPLGHVDVSIPEPRLEIREAGGRGGS